MAEDWFADVRKYAPDADADVVAGLVRYCGIALRNRDSSLVSFSDPVELGRVREKFLKKKLVMTHPDSLLDDAIAAVGERMKGDRTKNRVTVYYLLADRFDSLSLFLKTPKTGGASKGAGRGAGTDPSTTSIGGGAVSAAFAPTTRLESEGASGSAPSSTGTSPDTAKAANDESTSLAPSSSQSAEFTSARPLASTSATTGPERAGDTGRPDSVSSDGESRERLGAYSSGPVDDEGGSKSRLWLWLLLGLLILLLLFFWL